MRETSEASVLLAESWALYHLLKKRVHKGNVSEIPFAADQIYGSSKQAASWRKKSATL